AKIRSQEGIDKGNIVMDAPNFEDFLSSQAEFLVPGSPSFQVVAMFVFEPELPRVPAMLDIAQQLDAQLVRVETCPVSRHRSGMVVGVVDALPRLEGVLGHDRAVPEAGPSLV